MRQNVVLCGNGLAFYYTITTSDALDKKRGLLKSLWEMGKILVTKIFNYSHTVFCSIEDKLNVLSYICYLQMLSVWTYRAGIQQFLSPI